MRTLALAALTMVTAFGANQAGAQAVGARLGPGGPGAGASYPMPGTIPARPYPGAGGPVTPPPPVTANTPPRAYPDQRPVPSRAWQDGGRQGGGWQGGGRWSGGMNAPGGWSAYRRPSRGYRLPVYWTSPDFYIGDFRGFGLYAPPQGYGWQRYYDDAVLVDGRGRVRDMVYGMDWDGGYGEDAYPPPHQPPYQPLPPFVQGGSVTTYTTSSGYAGGGYAGGYYPGATTTVVTIQGAPSVTTTTTDYVEETTTQTRYVAPRRVYRAKKRVYRPVRCSCRRAAPVEQPIRGS